MVHGPRFAGPDCPRPPGETGWPQRWQNRACGDSSARQKLQARAERLAPQLLQNFPVPPVPQTGQVVDDSVMVKT
jgi:hypothetical protein